MSYKSHRIGPDRVFDHLYDPLYITSGTKDIWRENHNALYRSAPVRIYPQYGTMFTDLPRCPRNYYIQRRNPLPIFPFVDESGTYNNGQVTTKCKTAVIGGRDRAKFFNVPLNNEVNMNLQLDMKKDHICCGQQSLTPKEAFRSIACETLYREQSAQTKPWMPPIIVDETCTETPELVYAAKLINSNSAPGILEVKQLERARRRRQLEKQFAQSEYANDWNMRRAFCEALEWEDRVGREDELDYCQQLRLRMVEKMMNSREKTMQNNFTVQMESTINRLEADKEKKLNTLRINHQRTLRRLDKQFGEKSRRSKVLAKEHQQTSFVSYNTDFEARLDNLHKMPTMPTNLERFTQPKVDITKPKQPRKEVKKGLWTDKFLTNLYESLKVIQHKVIHQRTAKCLIDIREEILHYVTTAKPSVESYENELEYQHAVFLQELIKGRAIQSILHDDKNANQALIDQLKETFQLESVRKAELSEDWNEDSLMDFLGTYIDQEFDRYAKEKEIYDRRMFAEQERQQQQTETENKVRKDNEELASDYLDEVLTDVFKHVSKCPSTKQISDSLVNEISAEDIVPDVLANLILPEIYKKLPDENVEDKQFDQQNEHELVPFATGGEDELVRDAIEVLLQKVIPHPAEDVTNDIINAIVKRTVEWSSSLDDQNVDSLDKEIGDMLDNLCDQLLNNLDEDVEADDSESENDSPDE